MTGFMRFSGGRMKALTLSYGDGVRQDVRMMEILNKHGIKCAFNLNGSSYETDTSVSGRRLQAKEAPEAYRALQFSADGRRVYSPSAQTVWFKSGQEDVAVAPGEVKKIR